VTFRSKIDSWLVVVLGAALALPLIQAFTALREGDNAVVPVVVFMVLVVLLVWLLLTTKYTINSETLVIQSGPLKVFIDRSEIVQIVPTKSIVASPAMSLDRLRIDYAGGRKSVLVSPRDKAGFLKAIAVSPTAERGGRVSNAA
jgi:uncharacterized membrane protein YdbT with pleckstrin-like domain